jgi:dCMP deaminase
MWHDRFFDLADLVASWSKDPSTKVGAVIIRPDRTIASVGYNGFPRGVDDTYTTREDKLLRTVHAEANAILTAREPLHGYTLYVTPLHPCANCAGLIIQSGIKVVHFKAHAASKHAWTEHASAMASMFINAEVEFVMHENGVRHADQDRHLQICDPFAN